MIVGVFITPRARVGGRNRADLQSSARKIARIFDRKIAQFRSTLFPAVPEVRFFDTRFMNTQQETPFQMRNRGSSNRQITQTI